MKLKEACGVFGIYSFDFDRDIARTVYYALFALQHRGQESAGIAVSNGKSIKCHKGLGLAFEVFKEEDLVKLSGKIAIGHVRYSTTGSNTFANAQPIVVQCIAGELAIAHNGNIVNADEIRYELEEKGVFFQTTTDSEVIAAILSQGYSKSLEQRIKDSFTLLKGAYSLVIMTNDKLIAVRDPNGFRPLCLGKYNNSYVVASESIALDSIGAQFLRDIEPGEILVIDSAGLRSEKLPTTSRKSLCVFEYVYFARPDSVIEGISVYMARYRMGVELAKEYPVEADLVVGVPDSGTVAAIGYSDYSKIPNGLGLIKNRYIARTFIQPSQKMRSLGVKLKLSPLREIVKDRRIVLVDDSIVRGTTMHQIVKMLKDAGAREVHVRISSPPVRYSCYFGIDTPTRKELVASQMSVEEIRKLIEAESLGYLSIEGLVKAVGLNEGQLCLACFNGNYPLDVPKEGRKYLFEKR
ncbi:amidophosphoribosyltransferase [Pseudothermotoga thermarum]|uniref:Amidophosphoribosyltransferase n=1 Tax=Pseudothermotoga thermarum DSM 5069 TaxID=688269 RepID=F7YWW0_9THEM|nr:amidophosphoribosyltransferase [Pseudothermotoga thermarum]AEH50552.1 amidophosphoribosyltransferase [Pseudothermotoga thermarum DSM 5069]